MKEKIIAILKEWLQAKDDIIFTDDIAIDEVSDEIMEAYVSQQSPKLSPKQPPKMPTREECDKKMFEILSQSTSLGKDLRGVRSPTMMMAEYSEWLRNQIER